MALAYYDDDEAKVSKIFENGVGKLVGLSLTGAGVLFMAMLLSYSVDDPSPMNVTRATPVNALGWLGAYLADPMFRMLGRAAWVLPLVLFLWGIRKYLNSGSASIVNRIVFLPVAMLIAAVFFASNSLSADWPFKGIGMGGIIGDQLLGILLSALPLPTGLALFVATVTLAIASFLITAFVAGYHRHELYAYAGKLWGDARIAFAFATAQFARGKRATRERVGARGDAPGNTQNWRGRIGAGFGRLASQVKLARRNDGERPKSRTINIHEMLAGTAQVLGGGQSIGDDPNTLVDFEPKFQSDNPAIRAAVAKKFAEHQKRLREHGQLGAETETRSDRAPLSADEPIVKTATKTGNRLSNRARAEAEPAFSFEAEAAALEYQKPSLLMLQSPETIKRHIPPREALEASAKQLKAVLDDYGVKGEIVAVRPGPVVTMYELEPAAGIKASRIIGLADDIARSMSALTARVATVPGRSVIGIELPNDMREMVLLREIFAQKTYGDSKLPLPLALGKDIAGEPIVANLAKMPHLLIAGTTGSGKSVAINTMILSLLYHATPDEVRLIMIDPKMLELSVYDGIPHLLSPVVTDPKKAVVALKWVVSEMEERYRKMSKMGVRNIDGFNARVKEALAKGEGFIRTVQTGFDDATGEPIFETEEYAPETMPYIVVVVDEMADLMLVAGKEIEAAIQRLAQMARASGIHIIMATQRPSVDVITGTIKANFPTRISFQVTSKIDSRTILGEMGAEQLLGQGDMLYMAGGGRVQRVHGPFVSDEEVEEVVRHLKAQGAPVYESGVLEGPEEDQAQNIDMLLGLGSGNGDSDDQLYDQAVMIVARDRKASTSYIQRKLSIGYNKAAKLVERMEEQGVITEANHVGKRDVLVPEIE